VATTVTARIGGSPARGALDRVTPAHSSKLWTFRAKTFAALSFIAPLTHGPTIGGTNTTRVTGV
jgi:hypothetical protein